MGDDDVPPPWQRLTQRLECFAPHDHAPVQCRLFEKPEVIGQMPEQLVVFSNGIVFGCGDNDGYP